jgi:valyl-tRNA synthetase
MTVKREDPTTCSHCGSENIEQDPDVLDTWFSSGLWPFSTLGWPDKTPDLNYFYPTSILETGYDILFFWVARMIMAGLEFTAEIPFHTVYLHGLIRDGNGKKMSKSYGNAIDPLEVMDDLGTDALRFTLLVGSTPGKDINISLDKVQANRNFANKLWNASRFILNSLENLDSDPDLSMSAKDYRDWTLADSWIWAALQDLIRDVDRLFENYQYGEAGRLIYEFFWGSFADWYLEIAKLQISKGGEIAYHTVRTMVTVLDLSLRLLHPFIPFVTEAIWGHLKSAVEAALPLEDAEWPEALIIAPWPEPRPVEGWEQTKVADFVLIQEIIRSIRNLRSENNVKPSVLIPALIVSERKAQILKEQSQTIASLARIDHSKLEITERIDHKPEGHIALVVGQVEIYLPLAGAVDFSDEVIRLERELKEVEMQISRLEALLSSQFVEKAPQSIVEKERQKLADYQETTAKLKTQLQALDQK